MAVCMRAESRSECFHWIDGQKGVIPPNAIPFGYDPSGEALYLGKAYDYYLNFGIVSPSKGVLTCLEDHKDLYTSSQYEMLTCDISDVYYWESHDVYTSPDIPDNAFTLSYNDKTTLQLFFGRVTSKEHSKFFYEEFGISTDPSVDMCLAGFGYYHPRDGAVLLVEYMGRVVECSQFSIFCCHWNWNKFQSVPFNLPSTTWVQCTSDRSIPGTALAAGVNPNGEQMFIGRAEHDNENTVVGYVTKSDKRLRYSWGCEEHVTSFYDVLTMDAIDNIDWEVYSNGDVPIAALIGGQQEDEDIFIGRTVTSADISTGRTYMNERIQFPGGCVRDAQLVGKVHCDHQCLYVPWDGGEYIYPAYEVLVGKYNPKSLKHLCRIVIITATWAIPDRINSLPLPNHLKGFCQVTREEKPSHIW